MRGTTSEHDDAGFRCTLCMRMPHIAYPDLHF